MNIKIEQMINEVEVSLLKLIVENPADLVEKVVNNNAQAFSHLLPKFLSSLLQK
ncbi:hypothetical protein [Mycoplasmopsis fermentans]|uniref:hypothetical protein n=1 Tax=Mycoplasmopsis fermentans TaxID=2115 RepID=UPI0002ECAE95|nr:hypothetical protein [Mycoplasmopsis fermentans]